MGVCHVFKMNAHHQPRDAEKSISELVKPSNLLEVFFSLARGLLVHPYSSQEFEKHQQEVADLQRDADEATKTAAEKEQKARDAKEAFNKAAEELAASAPPPPLAASHGGETGDVPDSKPASETSRTSPLGTVASPSSGDTPKSAATSSPSVQVTVCQNVQDLRPFHLLRGMETEYDCAMTADDVKNIGVRLSTFKTAVKGLGTALKLAVKDPNHGGEAADTQRQFGNCNTAATV